MRVHGTQANVLVAVTLPAHDAGEIVPLTVQRGVYVPVLVNTHDAEDPVNDCQLPQDIATVVALEVLHEIFEVNGIFPVDGVVVIELQEGVVLL